VNLLVGLAAELVVNLGEFLADGLEVIVDLEAVGIGFPRTPGSC
jgi:hypothetical protein